MAFVTYTQADNYTLKNPTFENMYFNNIPKLDYSDLYNPSNGTNYIKDENIYDELLNTLEHSSTLESSHNESLKTIGNFNVDKAVEKLHQNTHYNLKTGSSKNPSQSAHMCARSVRTAMEAGGLSTNGRPKYGGQYGQFLLNNNWEQLPKDTKPQKGDIAVTVPHGDHTGGHVSMYDGKQWVSDFVQRSMYVYNSANDNNTKIYRYRG